jgi:predicted unusual protein kinase regulating ubiquinone biosynthesis (AarF/ABC1/UbiB family)
MALYGAMLADSQRVRIPEPVPALSTDRLLAMTWLDGNRLLDYRESSLEDRNRIGTALFEAWWRPFAEYGVIHGDPHLGNYTVREQEEAGTSAGGAGKPGSSAPVGINLLDFGCVRIFPPRFVAGVVDLYHALLAGDLPRTVEAFRAWGFRDLNGETIEILTIWAKFIYAPLLDDRVRTIADGVAPMEYGRQEMWEVKRRLKPKNALTIPREFVLMDRAAIGLGSVMLHLKAELNFHRLFESTIRDFDEKALAKRQKAALARAGLD